MAYIHQPYPKMLYRDGASYVVADHRQEQGALADGWGLTPDWTAAMTRAATTVPPPVEPVAPLPESVASVPVVHENEPAVSVEPVVVKRKPGRPRKT